MTKHGIVKNVRKTKQKEAQDENIPKDGCMRQKALNQCDPKEHERILRTDGSQRR